MPDVDHYDFFVSYSRSDNANGWISNFVEELLAEHRKFAAGRDLTYFFDKHEIGAGADWQHTLNHGIAHSKLFVAFISPNYFASEWCRKEWRAWIDAEIAKHILTAGVRPVYIVEVPGLTDGKLSDHDFAKQIADFLKISEGDRVKLLAETPPVVKHLRRRQMTHNQPFCDVHSFYTEGVETLRRDDLRQVLSKLAQDLDHHAELLAKADASITTIPPYNRNFSGRLDELLQLREWLDKDDRTGVIHGVHGLGGIGKTELALTYAHGYASAYPGGRFLIQCDGKTSLREAILTQHDFTSLFADKISDDQRKDPAEYFATIQRHLSHRLESLGHVLLLLDNVTDTALLTREQTDALTKLGPKLHLLATTRLHAPPTHKDNWISLDRLPGEDALELLEKHRPIISEEDRQVAWQIVKRLDGFTLAVELTAAFLAANQSTSYARMSEYLDLDDLEEMAEDSGVELIRHNHERRLSAVLGPVLDGLKPAERRFMEYAALLPPDQVPLPWLKELVAQDFPELAQEGRLKNPWDEVWQKLEKLSLISRTKEDAPEPRIFRVHRLVQELVVQRIHSEDHILLQAIATDVMNLISNRCHDLQKATQWQDKNWELESLTAVAESWPDSNPEVVALLDFVGDLWLELSGFTKAEPLLRRALKLKEQKPDADPSGVAASLELIASLLKRTNRLTEAESMIRRSLDIRKQCFGPDDVTVAASMSHLASVLSSADRFTEAESLLRRSLEITESKLGKNEPDVATCLVNLAGIITELNRLEEAESLYHRALMIKEHHFGADHHEIAPCLGNLAVLLRKSNRLDEAIQLSRRALAIVEHRYGPQHMNVADLQNNIAVILISDDRFSEAEHLCRRSLEIYEQLLDPAHPAIAEALFHLATVFFSTQRFSEATRFLRRALEIYEQSDPSHPNAKTCRYNLMLLRKLNSGGSAHHLKNQTVKSDENDIGEKSMPAHLDKTGRNDPCPCGSGKKYKKCCGV